MAFAITGMVAVLTWSPALALFGLVAGSMNVMPVEPVRPARVSIPTLAEVNAVLSTWSGGR